MSAHITNKVKRLKLEILEFSEHWWTCALKMMDQPSSAHAVMINTSTDLMLKAY